MSSSNLSDHDSLVRIIRTVRRRWRLRMAVKGLAIVLGAGLLVYLVSAFGMDRFRFAPEAVTVFRIFAYVTLVAIAARFFVWPLSRRVSDERIALYLEEHEPSLEMRFSSAVEFGGRAEDASATYSPEMVRRLIENAADRCAAVEYGRRVERAKLVSSSGWLAGTTLAALILILVAPPFISHSTPFLVPWGRAAAENPYSIQVEPGNTRVAVGSELKVVAKLINFSSDEVQIAVQRGATGDWERLSMGLDEETGEYLFFLFDLEQETEYFVEASGVRSSLFRVEVAELPYVEQLSLEYHFPSYTGLDPVRQENGGDIAALRGTEVRLWVTPTIPVTGGSIVFAGGDSLSLEPGPDGTLAGALQVARDGMYRVVFEMADGTRVVGSPDYLIDVLSDQPPSVSFSRPGRDINVSSIEEVFVEAEAQDDYGIRSLELIYSVNGGPEDTLSLYRGSRKQVSAGHTFYLEEIELVPGDFLSYYARANDDNRVSGRQTAVSDIYFMEVRPFDRSFRQAEQAPMPGGGGPTGFESSLARQQRDIIAATFNLIRDQDDYSTDAFEENLATLALAQGQLRGDVETLAARIESRGIVRMDSSFAIIAEALPLAAEAMREAEERLGVGEPQEALPPEQRALQQLQRAEAAFREVQVGQNQQGGGGGGGMDAEELAELFELELDKQRNQYEQVQRNRQQQVNEQIDETLQKVQELARRQQQENERLRAQANQSQGQSSGGRSQRQLAEETEELARRLERLARERSRPELEETARRLREAAEEMRRAAANARNQGDAQGQAALDRLREARRQLEGSRAADLQREIDDAARRAARLEEEQRDVTSDVRRLTESDRYGSERLRRLLERKEEMASEVSELEAQLDRLAREARGEQREAARKLQEAANSIRDDKLEDKILYSRGVVQQRSQEYAENFEEQIGRDLEGLRERIENARDAVGESEERRLGRTLDEARDLARSLESLQERTRRQAEAGAEASQERDGEGAAAEGEPRRAEEPALDSPDGRPRFAPGDARQFRREFGERRREAERLREALEREGIDASALGPVIADLRRLEGGDEFGDPRGLAELQAQVIRDLKRFEYVLRRELLGGDERELLLSGSDEVPAGYRELVDAYYKALAEERRQ